MRLFAYFRSSGAWRARIDPAPVDNYPALCGGEAAGLALPALRDPVPERQPGAGWQ